MYLLRMLMQNYVGKERCVIYLHKYGSRSASSGYYKQLVEKVCNTSDELSLSLHPPDLIPGQPLETDTGDPW